MEPMSMNKAGYKSVVRLISAISISFNLPCFVNGCKIDALLFKKIHHFNVERIGEYCNCLPKA